MLLNWVTEIVRVIPTKEGSLAALGMTTAVIPTEEGSLAALGMTHRGVRLPR